MTTIHQSALLGRRATGQRVTATQVREHIDEHRTVSVAVTAMQRGDVAEFGRNSIVHEVNHRGLDRLLDEVTRWENRHPGQTFYLIEREVVA